MLIYLLRRQSSRPVPARGLRVIKGLAYRDSSEGKLLAAQGKALEAQGKLLGALHADVTDVKADVVGVKVDMTGVKATLQEQGTQLKEVSGKLARVEKDIQLVLKYHDDNVLRLRSRIERLEEHTGLDNS